MRREHNETDNTSSMTGRPTVISKPNKAFKENYSD